MDKVTERALMAIKQALEDIQLRLAAVDSGLDYLLGVGEVAKILGTKSETVRSWVKAGQLKGVYLPGGSVMKYRKSEVMRFMDTFKPHNGIGGKCYGANK